MSILPLLVIVLLGVVFVAVAVLGIAALFWYKFRHQDQRGFPVEPPKKEGR